MSRKNFGTSTFRETSCRADLKLEEVAVERQILSFLYADGDRSWFMRLEPARLANGVR